jgi:Ca2+-binding EF-hand superfamily protein
MSAEYIFNKNCAGDKINRAEFKNLLSSLIDNLAEFEVNCIFSELDKEKRGFIPKDNFLHWFSFDEQEK